MRNFTEALYTKTAGSAFMTSIGGRFYENEATEGAEFPYCCYLIVSDIPYRVFQKTMEDFLIQFSIFSAASSSGEIKDIYANLKSLYDDCSFSITGSTLIYMQRENTVTMRDEVTTGVWHYAVDYSILTRPT